MGFVSLTTDFGGEGGVMRGVIWKIAPNAQVADITHHITPQNIIQAAWLIYRQTFYFPDNSVHVVVIDPGVGTERRPIAVQAGPQYYVGPDNGVFTLIYEKAEEEGWPLKVVHTNKKEYWLPDISDIFHGRDIFSPVGAHLAAGVPIDDLGEVIVDSIRTDIPRPIVEENGAKGQVNMVFKYLGNIITNIHRDDLPPFEDLGKVQVTYKGTTIQGMNRTFGERDPGTLISLFDSKGYVMVAVVNGSADELLNPEVGDEITIQF